MIKVKARPHARTSRLLVPLLAAIIVAAFSFGRRSIQRWGATPSERHLALPGDEVVPNPSYLTTRAVTVRAPAESIWPWLVQMGYQRGGLYSYDWLDRLFGYIDQPSATEILPEFQHLKPGDVIPLGTGPDWPVHAVEQNRALVLNPRSAEFNVSWAFVLEPAQSETTRLISRVRARFERNPVVTAILGLVLEPAALLMERRMLLGIKERAESTPRVSG